MRHGRKLAAAVAAAMLPALVTRASARAADEKPPPDLGVYSLSNPTPDDKLRELCTDRPTKSTIACTVEPGRWQVETDLVNAAFSRQGGVTADTLLFTNPTIKLGLTDRIDVEATLSPYELVRTHASSGATRELTGVGDLYLRAKYAVLGNGGEDFALLIVPYVKAPTARLGVGDGAVEGGVVVPVTVELPQAFTLTVDPEIDVFKNQNDTGRHVSTTLLVNLSHELFGDVSGAAEVWSQQNLDPAGTVVQASFDLALTWTPKATPNLQFDGGVNVGLNHATPGAQIYVGVSRRF